MLDHDVHRIARLDRDFAAGILKLLDGDDAFGFVSEVDDHVLGGHPQDYALKNLVGGGRGEVTIILEEILVVLWDLLVRLPVIVHGH